MALGEFWELCSSQLPRGSLARSYRISSEAQTDCFSAKESRELIVRFLKLFSVTFFFPSRTLSQFLTTSDTLNSHLCLLNLLRQLKFCLASSSCFTGPNVAPGRKLGHPRTQFICFLFLSNHSPVLPYIQYVKTVVSYIFPAL